MPLAKLETARAKDWVCGDRAKSGTHQLLLMTRAVVTVPPRQQRWKDKFYCKRRFCAPPLHRARDFWGSQTGDVCRASGQLRRRSSGNPNKVQQYKVVLALSSARGQPGLLGQVQSGDGAQATGTGPAAEEETRSVFQGCCRTWQLFLFSLSPCLCMGTVNFSLLTLKSFEVPKEAAKTVL